MESPMTPVPIQPMGVSREILLAFLCVDSVMALSLWVAVFPVTNICTHPRGADNIAR